VSQRSRIARFAIENKLPSVYSFREHIEAGGLISYTPNSAGGLQRSNAPDHYSYRRTGC